MQPLGLTSTQLDAYHRRLCSSHDFRMYAEVLDMEESLLGPAEGLQDGQITLARDNPIGRTLSITAADPDHALHLDPDSPFDTALFANRMLRIRHELYLPEAGRIVTATPFIGPLSKITRDGPGVTLECNDKTALYIEGCPPMTAHKGQNVVDAIVKIARNRCGERRFRVPAGNKRRLKKDYKVGWKPETAPWVVMTKMADSIGLELLVSCDGYLTLRESPDDPVVVLDGSWLTGLPKTDQDISALRNYVLGEGAKKGKGKKANTITAVARPNKKAPLSPEKLGRHSVPRYLPLLIEDSDIKKKSKLQRIVDQALRRNMKVETSIQAGLVPLYHLDRGDPFEISVAGQGALKSHIGDLTLPVTLGGDAALGVIERRSKRR